MACCWPHLDALVDARLMAIDETASICL